MMIGLQSEVTWKKEIVGWHLCNKETSSVTTDELNTGPNYMILNKVECRAGVDTILLRKAKFLGVMTSMYALEMSTIWPYWGGRRVTLTWVKDTGVGGGSASEQDPDDHYYEDGTLLKGDASDATFVVYGDAKFLIPNPQVFEAMGFDWANVWVRPEERMAKVATVPRDFTLLKEMSTDAIYVVYGGAKFLIPSPEVFDTMGFDWGKVGVVPDGALAAIPAIPSDGTLLKELSTDPVYLIKDQKKSHITSEGRFNELCQYYENVRVVPDGAAAAIPQGPDL
jgi:hypothetical protein